MTIVTKHGHKVMREMKAGEFKAKCLKVMDEVQATGEPVVITKRGKPVARLVAEAPESGSILEFLQNTARIVDPNDDLLSVYTPEELAKLEQNFLDEADKLYGPVKGSDTGAKP